VRIVRVELRHVQLELVFRFETSSEVMTGREFLLLRLDTEAGATVWSEVVVSETPFYTYETVSTAWHILDEFMIPQVVGQQINRPGDVLRLVGHVRGHNMARAGLEMGAWGLLAVQEDLPLATLLGGERAEIPVGISIGIQESVTQLLREIESFLERGYQRIKLKIKPGWDVDMLRQVRKYFPTVPLMADANGAYSRHDIDHLRRLDAFGLTMIEQPLDYEDIIDHAGLQAVLDTPICLDESIHTPADARKAIELGACRVINIKPGRVGGLGPSRDIHDLCAQHDVPVWCGGMLESGIGRAYNVALSTLPNFRFPGDTAGSARYWKQDIVNPPVEVTDRGTIVVPTQPGIGYEPDEKRIDRVTIRKKVYT